MKFYNKLYRTLLVILGFLVITQTRAQSSNKMANVNYCDPLNLVPNCSFEDTVQCPNAQQINFAQYWSNPTIGSPAYFNQCDTNLWGVPNNRAGIQIAKSGNAYGGMGIFYSMINNTREYIQAMLTDTMKMGKKYYIEFYVSLAEASKYVCNDIGTYFSTTTVGSGGGGVLPYLPQVSNISSSNSLTNKETWARVSGSFIANGGEKYITIGNFKDDANSDTVFVGSTSANPWDEAYYYIDDVSVIEDTTTEVAEVSRHDSQFNLYPNPAANNLTLSYYSQRSINTLFEIYDVIGNKVISSKLNSSQTVVDITNLTSGVYFYKVMADGVNIKTDKLIIMKE